MATIIETEYFFKNKFIMFILISQIPCRQYVQDSMFGILSYFDW